MKKEKIGKIILLSVLSIAILAILYIKPIVQDENYHNFSDNNSILGISNFWNVISNAPFILVGIIGLLKARSEKKTQRVKFFFFSIILVGFGSGYYHYFPSSTTLIWDRLPMTLAFMTLFSVVLSEFVSDKLGRNLLIPLLIFGISTILFWEFGANHDLRPYVFVQFYPMLAIPIILLFFTNKNSNKTGYWLLLLCYVLAKITEYLDVPIFEKIHWISGHSLKHILAALGIYAFTFTLRNQKIYTKSK